MKIEAPFSIDKEAQFRFVLSLESKSLEAHSLISEKDSSEELKKMLEFIGRDYKFRAMFRELLLKWNEVHK